MIKQTFIDILFAYAFGCIFAVIILHLLNTIPSSEVVEMNTFIFALPLTYGLPYSIGAFFGLLTIGAIRNEQNKTEGTQRVGTSKRTTKAVKKRKQTTKKKSTRTR